MATRWSMAVFVCLAVVGMGRTASGISVAFSFSGSTGSEPSFAADGQPADATVSPMSRGTGLTASAAANAFSSSGWTTAAVRDLNDYYTFTITPDSGFGMSLTRLELDERRSLTGIREWSIYSSLDSFGIALGTFSVDDNDSTRVNQGVNLGAPFANLTSSLEFRIYGFRSEAAGGTWRVDNVELSLTTFELVPASVPESASTFSLLGLGLAGLAGFWRLGSYSRRAAAT